MVDKVHFILLARDSHFHAECHSCHHDSHWHRMANKIHEISMFGRHEMTPNSVIMQAYIYSDLVVMFNALNNLNNYTW